MSRNLTLPYFPVPPNEYNQSYFSEVIRAYSVYLTGIQNPGEGRNTFTVFTNLQQNDYQLEEGATFQVDGALRVVVLNKPHPAGVSCTGGVGEVTVSTP